MVRDQKAFEGVLTKIGSKAIDEEIVLNFTIRHIAEGEVQHFLQSYESKTVAENVNHLFSTPVAWKNISIESNISFKVEFDEIEFEARLEEIKVARSFKKGSEFFTYNLMFSKETKLENDSVFQP